MKKRLILGVVLGLGLLLGGAGCGKPSCDKAVAHTYQILEADMKKLPPEAAKLALAKMPTERKAALRDCKADKKTKLSKARYKCIMGAKTKVDLDKCESK